MEARNLELNLVSKVKKTVVIELTDMKETLAKYKIPKAVEFRSQLPKTMVGKILRRALVEEETKKLQDEKRPIWVERTRD